MEVARLDATPKYIRYYATLPRGHLAREAWEEALQLDKEGRRSWIGNLRVVVESLPRSGRRLQELVEGNSQIYLLHGRVEVERSGEL
ncbi:hypothetical protein CC2G_003543 [Coprinopsis cinerea AmutBmut pab1-1]|nr:hypothetical protein CC2G_003543 [Coprinopsis cinerea AmutBmut pab1-1]